MSAPTLARHHAAPRVRPFPGAPDTAPTVVLAPLTAASTPRLGRRACCTSTAPRSPPRVARTAPSRGCCSSRWTCSTAGGTLEKFMVLEVVARIPYQIGENAAYRAGPPPPRRRARPPDHTDRGEPGAAGQRAVAPADPQRARGRPGRRPLVVPLPAAAVGDGREPLPPVPAAARPRAAPGVPPGRRLRGPRRAHLRRVRRRAPRARGGAAP